MFITFPGCELDIFQSSVLSISYKCLYISSTFWVQMLLQFYAILYETYVYAYAMTWRYGCALDKILKFCFFFSVLQT